VVRGTISTVLVLIVIAAVVIVAVVVFLAMGRGGELSGERADYLPIDLGPVSATDVALLRPPTGLWGYNMQATDEALELIAESIRERDVRIVALEQLVTDLSREHGPTQILGSPYLGTRHRRTGAMEAVTAASEAAQAPHDLSAAEPGRAATSEAPRPPFATPMAGLAEPARLPFQRPRPSGEAADAAPEESHD
jgi:hypothetical protein